MNNEINKLCEECGKGHYELVGNDWQRMAFNDEEYVWIYKCDNCGDELVTTNPL